MSLSASTSSQSSLLFFFFPWNICTRPAPLLVVPPSERGGLFFLSLSFSLLRIFSLPCHSCGRPASSRLQYSPLSRSLPGSPRQARPGIWLRSKGVLVVVACAPFDSGPNRRESFGLIRRSHALPCHDTLDVGSWVCLLAWASEHGLSVLLAFVLVSVAACIAIRTAINHPGVS